MENSNLRKIVRWSRSLKMSTLAFASAILASDIWLLYLFFNVYGSLVWFINAVYILLTIAILFACYAYGPKLLSISNEYLTLYKGVGNLKIRLSDIVESGVYKPDAIFDVRVFGIGGVCGYVGKFYNKKFGSYTSYVGDYSQSFYVKTTKGKRYVFSCEDRDDFLLMLKSKAGGK